MSNTQQIINELNLTIGGFTGKVNVKVQEVNQATAKIRATADTTLAEIKRFKTDMIENEQMQSAQENVLRINQIIRERFYDYDTIRKTVMGVVKDFDLNLVRNKTIEELSEELWITSSRYWLSYTLIALSAWINDNKLLAENAAAESSRVSESKTALFFCLANFRFGRIEPARAWLSEYFRTVVPDDLKDEAAIMLQAYINGVFGADERTQAEVQEAIDGWTNELKNNKELSKELVNMYETYIKNLRPNNTLNTRYLSRYCTNYNELPTSYNEALKFDLLLRKIKEVDVENINQTSSNYKKRIDLILKDLITNYDEEELELKQQQEYFQLIIDNKGKEDIATQQYNELLNVRNQKQNFGKKCLQWALYANSEDINVHVRKFGFQNTKPWLLDAILNWSKEFEEKFPNSYNIRFNIADKVWEATSNGEDQVEQIASVEQTVEQMKKSIVWDKKVKGRLIFGIIFAILGVVLLILHSNTPVTICGIVALVISLILLIMWLVRFLNGDKRYKAILNASLDTIKGCMSELTEYRRIYLNNVNKKGELFSLIEHL
ncbi:MAG: hypothetical protein ACI32E_03105 [Bacilli bacterium]